MKVGLNGYRDWMYCLSFCASSHMQMRWLHWMVVQHVCRHMFRSILYSTIILSSQKIILCKVICYYHWYTDYEKFTPLYRTTHDDLTPFKKLMSLVTDELKQQSSLVIDVFPEKMDAFYMFADRVFEDVVIRNNRDGKWEAVCWCQSFR